jgi:hypothetical protein
MIFPWYIPHLNGSEPFMLFSTSFLNNDIDFFHISQSDPLLAEHGGTGAKKLVLNSTYTSCSLQTEHYPHTPQHLTEHDLLLDDAAD